MALEDKLLEKNKHQTINYFHKIIIFSLLLVILIEGLLIFMLVNRKPVISVITDEGVPINNQIVDQNLNNLINTEQFILYFLNQIYNYNKATYSDNIKGALSLMSSSLKEQYLSEIERGGYIDQVEKHDITSSLTVKRINEKDIKQEDNGYIITVNAVRLNITDFISRNRDIEIKIGYRETDFTKDNIWGLEVFYLREEVI